MVSFCILSRSCYIDKTYACKIRQKTNINKAANSRHKKLHRSFPEHSIFQFHSIDLESSINVHLLVLYIDLINTYYLKVFPTMLNWNKDSGCFEDQFQQNKNYHHIIDFQFIFKAYITHGSQALYMKKKQQDI